MAADAGRLLALAEAISDGQPVDWAEAESTAESDDARDLVSQLRMLAAVADVHRPATSPSASTLEGTTWGPLTLLQHVGSGSYGAVYRARDARLERDVALKLLHHDASDESASLIIEEGRLLARIRHPHIVTVFGADRTLGRVGIWMEFVHGRTLEEILQTEGPFSAHEAALIGIDLCGALAAVHAQGIAHRDIKAQNVMREDGGRVVLMDFGAGVDLRRGDRATIIGTPACMAPEVLSGLDPTALSDLYSLAVLLFRLVTAAYPVPGRTQSELLAAHRRGDRVYLRDARPNLPPRFVEVVEKALTADPAARFASAGDMQAALEAAIVNQAASQTRGFYALWTVTILGLVLATAGALTGFLRSSGPPSAGAAPSIRAIGVRPLADGSAGGAQEYFAAGLTEVLLATLGGVRGVRVVTLESVPGEKHWRERAERLKVDAVLDGSVHRSDKRVRVSARLVHFASGAILWGRAFEGEIGEAFTLQGKIAADLVRDINVSLSANEQARLSRRYSVAADAEDAYLQGRYLLDTLTVPNLKEARALLERAVKIEPLYAPAHATLALTYMALGNVGAMTPDEVRALAPVAAVTAYTNDPGLAEAALALADVRFRIEWQWPAADEAYRHAIELNPSSTLARGRYARFLAAAGRPEQGLEQALEAYRIDPLSTEIHGVVGLMLYYARRYEEAIRHYQSRNESFSERTHIGLGRSLAAARRFKEAASHLKAAYEASGGDPALYAELARTHAAAGNTTTAREMLSELAAWRREGKRYIAPQDLAYVHAGLGEHDRAIDLLHEAVEAQASRLLWLKVDPRVDALRGDARFTEVLNRLGIR